MWSMSRYKKQHDEVNEKWNAIEPSELDRLRAAMQEKKQERMNGRLQTRFYQVMFDWGVLRLLTNGNASVVNPLEYTKWNRANAMIESADRKEQERIFDTYPEQRVEWEKRLAVWFKETKAALRKVNEGTKV